MHGQLISFILKRDEVSHHNSQTDGCLCGNIALVTLIILEYVQDGIDWFSMEQIYY